MKKINNMKISDLKENDQVQHLGTGAVGRIKERQQSYQTGVSFAVEFDDSDRYLYISEEFMQQNYCLYSGPRFLPPEDDSVSMVQGRASGKNIKYEELKRQVGIDRLKQEKQQTFWLRQIAIMQSGDNIHEKETYDKWDQRLSEWLKNQ